MSNVFVQSTNRGFSFIEILVVIAIVMIGLVSLAELSSNMIRALGDDELTQKASYYAQEGIEAVRLLRDESWARNIASTSQGTIYYLDFVGEQWELTTTAQPLLEGIFQRTVLFNDVYRDTNDDIVQSGGTLDEDTKEIVVEVSWGDGQQVTLTTYLTNFAGEEEALAIEYADGITDASIPGSQFPNNSGWGDPAQSFTPSEDLRASSAELLIRRATSDPSDIYVELRSDSPSTGTVLATSQTIDGASLPSTLSWVRFTFDTQAALTNGTTYYLRVSSTPSSVAPFSGAEPEIYWGYGFPGGYGNGTAYRFVTDSSHEELPDYDFSFRVYKSQ